MKDKTSLEISDIMRQYIEALVNDVVFGGTPFDDLQKNRLKGYCGLENMNYDDLEKNLTLLFGISEELKTTESKALENYLWTTARKCFCTEETIRELIKLIVKERSEHSGTSCSSFERVKAEWLKTQQDKEKATKKAKETQKARKHAEKRLADKQKSFEIANQQAEDEANKNAEKDLTNLITKKNKSIKKEEELKELREFRRNELQNAKSSFEQSKLQLEEENRKTKKTVWFTCIAVALCFTVMLIVYAIL